MGSFGKVVGGRWHGGVQSMLVCRLHQDCVGLYKQKRYRYSCKPPLGMEDRKRLFWYVQLMFGAFRLLFWSRWALQKHTIYRLSQCW